MRSSSPSPSTSTAEEEPKNGDMHIEVNSPALAKQKSNTKFGGCGERCYVLCEVLILAPVLLVIIGLFLIPTVYYALPSPSDEVRYCVSGNFGLLIFM